MGLKVAPAVGTGGGGVVEAKIRVETRRALTCDEDQNALESFRLDKAVEEAQESDEDASTSRAATPCQNGTEWGVIITDALQEAEFDGEEARLGALICSGLG